MHDLDWQGIKEERLEIKNHVRKFLLYPKFWEDSSKIITKNMSWRRIKFTKRNVQHIPTNNGIYCFTVIPPKPNNFWNHKYLFYIGKASSTSLRTRFKNYLDEKNGIGIGKNKPRIKVMEFLNMYENYTYFFYCEVSTKNTIMTLEENLINTYMPYVNTAIPEARIREEFKHIY